jgi:hypothetical protein
MDSFDNNINIKGLKAQSKFDWHLSNLVAFIRLNLFVKIELQKWLNKPFEDHITSTKKLSGGSFLKLLVFIAQSQ